MSVAGRRLILGEAAGSQGPLSIGTTAGTTSSFTSARILLAASGTDPQWFGATRNGKITNVTYYMASFTATTVYVMVGSWNTGTREFTVRDFQNVGAPISGVLNDNVDLDVLKGDVIAYACSGGLLPRVGAVTGMTIYSSNLTGYVPSVGSVIAMSVYTSGTNKNLLLAGTG